jgi:hypothetical protein
MLKHAYFHFYQVKKILFAPNRKLKNHFTPQIYHKQENRFRKDTKPAQQSIKPLKKK